MKINQISIFAVTAAFFFTLVGCEPTDGQIVLKEPKKEHVDREINWSVTHGLIDASGNPVATEEAE